jgi:DNA-binding NarL/FixJ family response regulator
MYEKQKQAIRVLIVDDHAILRMGLTTFLESVDDMVVVGEAANGQEALDLIQVAHPDVIIMDLSMPVMDGITATTIIRQQYPFAHVIVLSSTYSDEREKEALKAGAVSYLRKNIPTAVLAKAIREAVH